MNNEPKDTRTFADIDFISDHTIMIPKDKYQVEIPKGGGFFVAYHKKLNWWQIFWMRFIGWGVRKLDD